MPSGGSVGGWVGDLAHAACLCCWKKYVTQGARAQAGSPCHTVHGAQNGPLPTFVCVWPLKSKLLPRKNCLQHLSPEPVSRSSIACNLILLMAYPLEPVKQVVIVRLDAPCKSYAKVEAIAMVIQIQFFPEPISPIL